MSNVHLFVIKDDCLYAVSVHYRTAMRILEKGVEEVLPLIKHRFLDSGYLVLDINRKVIINGQSAFPVGKIVGKKGLCVIEA